MDTRRGYRAPRTGCHSMVINSASEAGESLARVEVIEGIVGKFACSDCQGNGWQSCQPPNSDCEEKCGRCKGAGFLLVGL